MRLASVRALFLCCLNAAALTLSACGGGGGGASGGTDAPAAPPPAASSPDQPASSPPPAPATYTLGGSVTGLRDGTSLVLLNGSGETLSLSSNGVFTFNARLQTAATYTVTVSEQPADQTCAVARGGGTVGAANVADIAVTCAPVPTTLTLSGLRTGASLSITAPNNTVAELKANGTYTLPANTSSSNTAGVRIEVQPAGQTCTIVPQRPPSLSNLLITCVTNPTYPIGGTLTGLQSGASVTLLNNASETLTLSASGSFRFASPVETGHAYGVTVGTQPAGQHCAVSRGTGAVAAAAVTDITVSCAALPTVGGSVTGLSTGYSLVLRNGSETVTLNGSGATQIFRFSTGLRAGETYGVSVSTQPVNGANSQTCAITNGSGTMSTAVVSNVSVACNDNLSNRYSIGGTVTGLTVGRVLRLQNNAGAVLDVNANGSIIFTNQLATAENYAVTIQTQPVGQVCTLGNATGTVNAAPVTNVTVSCVAREYTVSATVSGLSGGTGSSLTLLNNGGNALAITSNGSQTFSATLRHDQTYAVSVGTQPSNGQTCLVSQPSGTVNNANVSNITVTCGTYSQFVLVPNSGSNDISVFAMDATTGALTASGAPVASGGVYPYAIVTDPNGRYAYVTHRSSSTLSTFEINRTTGALTLRNTLSSVYDPELLTLDPSGTFLYVANRWRNSATGTLRTYRLNASTGLPTEVSSVATQNETRDIAITPSGRFAYTTSFFGKTVKGYAVDATTGALTELAGATYATGDSPYDIVIDPSGRFIYTVNYTDSVNMAKEGSVSAWRIDSTTGLLTPIAGSPFATGPGPFSLTIDAASRKLYVANYGNIFVAPNVAGDTVSSFSIDASTGALSSRVDVGTGRYPNAIRLDATGTFAFVVNANADTILTYRVNSTNGTLTPTGASAATGRYPEAFAVVRPQP